MSQTKTFPDCGIELPPDAPAGICPKCLLKSGLANSAADGVVHTAPLVKLVHSLDATKIAPLQQESNGAAPKIGTKIKYFGDYELLDEIGRGGMGIVYRARQVRLDRTVALKMILTGQLAGDVDVQRFHTEAEAAAQLNHPGIVPIYEVGEHEGHHYFSMGFIEGESLAARLNEGPLPPREAAEITKKIARAIAYAHQKKVIHRDLKPANILVDTEGEPKVTDFGVAKNFETDSGLTVTGQVLGTPGYMPPEQAAGEMDKIGPAADIYSLGAVLYALLTGRPPFQSANAVDALVAVMEQEPVAPRHLNPKIPRDLETICLVCLDKDPGKRFNTADELAEEIERFLAGDRIRSRRKRLETASYNWWGVRCGILGGVLAAIFGSVFMTLTTFLNAVSWVDWIFSPLAGGCMGLCIGLSLGALLGVIVTFLWNHFVIPVWILRQTRNPLVKVALGLNLVFISMVFKGFAIGAADDGPTNELDFTHWLPMSFLFLASLAATLGVIFCLAISPKSRAQGVLYGCVLLQIASLIVRSEEHLNIDLDIPRNIIQNLSGLLFIGSWLLFVVFLKKLAEHLEAPSLVTRASRLLTLIKLAIIMIGAGLCVLRFGWYDSFGITYIAATLVFAALPLLALVGILKFFTLVRDVYPIILQRL